MLRLSHSWTFATIRLPCWALPHFRALPSSQVIIVVISMVILVTAVITTANNIIAITITAVIIALCFMMFLFSSELNYFWSKVKLFRIVLKLFKSCLLSIS